MPARLPRRRSVASCVDHAPGQQRHGTSARCHADAGVAAYSSAGRCRVGLESHACRGGGGCQGAVRRKASRDHQDGDGDAMVIGAGCTRSDLRRGIGDRAAVCLCSSVRGVTRLHRCVSQRRSSSSDARGGLSRCLERGTRPICAPLRPSAIRPEYGEHRTYAPGKNPWPLLRRLSTMVVEPGGDLHLLHRSLQYGNT